MRLVVCALLLAACDGEEPFPIVPGGDDTVINPQVDAATGGPDANLPGTIDGRVCVLLDPRVFTTCADTGAGGITVTLGIRTATTADDGSFTITGVDGSSLVWTAAGPQIVTTATPVTSAALIPALPPATYDTLLANHNVVGQALHGQVFVHARSEGLPLAGVTASADPPSLSPPLYDGLSPLAWNVGPTGDLGVVWLPDVPAGAVTVTLVPPSGGGLDLALTVGDQTTSFAIVEFP